MSQEQNTLVSIHAYTGDQHQVIHALGQYLHHGTRVVVLSPADAPTDIRYPGIEQRTAGKRAYIGQDSLDRQIAHMEVLLQYPFEFFLMNDSDSFIVSADIPARLYEESEGVVWSNEVTDPRPHESPYPKIAMQPPYFLNRGALRRMLAVFKAQPIRAHPVTPYIDWFMVALTCEAGLNHRPFTALEHSSRGPTLLVENDPWKTLDYRVRYMGAVAMHPIKTPEQIELCVNARKFYEETFL